MYYIAQHKPNGTFLFLVDRNKADHKWWTFDLTQAFNFFNRTLAENRMSQFKSGKFSVVTKDRAEFLAHVTLAEV